MARTIDQHVADRNQRLIADFAANPRQSLEDLGAVHGCSAQITQKVLRDAGLISNDNKRPRLTIGERQRKSNLHVQIGRSLETTMNDRMLDRMGGGEVTRATVARDLKMSAQRLSAFLQGRIEPTLSELQLCAKFMKLELGELISNSEASVWKNYGKLPGTTG